MRRMSKAQQTEVPEADGLKEEIRTQRSSSMDSESLSLNEADMSTIEAELGPSESQELSEPLPQLHTFVLTPTHDLPPVEGFDGTEVSLEQLNDAIPISNDMFEGAIKFMIRDNPFCTYEFNGDKDVLWEIQIQVQYRFNICVSSFFLGLCICITDYLFFYIPCPI